MKTQDDARWRAQKAELGQKLDQQSAQAFIAFVEEWCERAEEIYDRVNDPTGLGSCAPIEALRRSLAPTEEHYGFLNTNNLANMLLVICANWEYGGDDFFETMTKFEQRIVVDMIGMIHEAMQASAEGEAVPDEALTLKYGQQVPVDG